MDEPTIIVCNPNGPLRVTGNFVIRDSQGKDFDLAGRNDDLPVSLRNVSEQAILRRKSSQRLRFRYRSADSATTGEVIALTMQRFSVM